MAPKIKGGVVMGKKNLYKSPMVDYIESINMADVLSVSGGSFVLDGYDESDFEL